MCRKNAKKPLPRKKLQKRILVALRCNFVLHGRGFLGFALCYLVVLFIDFLIIYSLIHSSLNSENAKKGQRF